MFRAVTCDLSVSIHCGCLFVALCVCCVLCVWFVCVAVCFVVSFRWFAFLFSPAVFVHVCILDCLVSFVHVWGASL